MNKRFFIAGWSENEDAGVYEVYFDTEAGKVSKTAMSDAIPRASYFAKDGDVLYALSEIGGPGDFAGEIHSYRITDEGIKKIDLLRGIPSGCPHIKVAAGNNIYFASYGTGAAGSAKIDSGKFGAITSMHAGYGTSVNPVRQEGPHAHIMCPDQDEKNIICCDLGTDDLKAYRIGENGELIPSENTKTPLGYGPRHMVFSSDGQYAYVVCELQYHLLTYRYLGEGRFELLDDLKIHPELPEDQNWGGAIKLSEDGRELYTTNRGTTLSFLDVLSLKEPAKPKLIGTLNDLDHPRDFIIFKDEAGTQYAGILNMNLNETAFYQYDPARITFTLLDTTDAVPVPGCIIEA